MGNIIQVRLLRSVLKKKNNIFHCETGTAKINYDDSIITSMTVDEQVEKAAKAELLELHEEWKKTIDNIKIIQISPKEAKFYRERMWQIKDGFRYRYAPQISSKLFSEAMDIFHIISTDLSLALRIGQENYENEMYKRRIEWAKVLGLRVILAIIVFALVFVLIKLVYNIEIPFYH